MGQTTQLQTAIAKHMTLMLVATVLLGGCSKRMGPVGVSGLEDGTAPKLSTPLNPTTGAQETYTEDQPTEAVQDPVEGPVNLPPIPRASSTPVDPVAMQVKAIAETISVMPAPGVINMQNYFIRAKITWTPVKGANGYRIYQREVNEGAAADDKGKLMIATPKWLPVAICGGGYGLLNLKVAQEYAYTVEGIDRAGNVIARGLSNCKPLPPLTIPYLLSPAQNEGHVGQTPYFKWAESRGADGYYIETFATVRGAIPAIPMWRGYRSNPESMNIMYGQQVDVLEGTKPMQWVLPLNIGQRYAWSVCAIRTDTHAMNTATAIARATAPMNYFLP